MIDVATNAVDLSDAHVELVRERSIRSVVSSAFASNRVDLMWSELVVCHRINRVRCLR